MGYYIDQYGRTAYQPDPPPMDRLQQLQAQRQAPPTAPGINWVSGEAGAKSWFVAANSKVLLMDNENPMFYIKEADPSGMPLPLRIFEYREVTPTSQNPIQNPPQSTQTAQDNPDNKYVTREEYEDLQGKYMEILEKLNSFHAGSDTGQTAKGTTAAGSGRRSKGGTDNE